MQTKISAALAAEIIKQNVSLSDVIARYHRAGHGRRRTTCPFHGGEHDNLGYDNSVFHCFVCGAKGDVIDFVRMYHHTDFPGAVAILDRDFNLRLDEAGSKEAEEAIRQRERNRAAERERQAQARKTFVMFTRVIRWIRNREQQTKVHEDMIAFLDRLSDTILDGKALGADPRATVRSVILRVKEAEREVPCGR